MRDVIADFLPDRPERRISPKQLAQGLGWFSVALGTAELLAPRLFTRLLGLRGQETLVRSYGARELGTGIGILRSKDPTWWLWGRVGGDALDIATVAIGLRGPREANAALALVSLAGVTAADAVCGALLARPELPETPLAQVEAAPVQDFTDTATSSKKGDAKPSRPRQGKPKPAPRRKAPRRIPPAGQPGGVRRRP